MKLGWRKSKRKVFPLSMSKSQEHLQGHVKATFNTRQRPEHHRELQEDPEIPTSWMIPDHEETSGLSFGKLEASCWSSLVVKGLKDNGLILI